MKKTLKTLISMGLFSVMSMAVSTVANADAGSMQVYGKVGASSGLTAGFGYSITDSLGVRGDISSAGRFSKDFNQRDLTYEGTFKNDKANVFLDYFPTDNGLRITTGLGFGATKIEANGHSRNLGDQTFRFGKKSYKVNLDANDTFSAETKYPEVSPYFGLGWGHDTQTKGLGFTADVGFYAGSPKTTVSLSSSLYEKLAKAEQEAIAKGATISEETRQQAIKNLNDRIAAEKERVRNKVERVRIMPVVNVGVSYSF